MIAKADYESIGNQPQPRPQDQSTPGDCPHSFRPEIFEEKDERGYAQSAEQQNWDRETVYCAGERLFLLFTPPLVWNLDESPESSSLPRFQFFSRVRFRVVGSAVINDFVAENCNLDTNKCVAHRIVRGRRAGINRSALLPCKLVVRPVDALVRVCFDEIPLA